MQYSNENDYGGDNYSTNKTKSILLVVAGGIILVPSGFSFAINLLYLFLDICALLITLGIISVDGFFMSEFNRILRSTLLSGAGVVAGVALAVCGARLAERGRK